MDLAIFYSSGVAFMDRDQLAVYKFIGIVFALLIAGAWIWSWINPADNNPVIWPSQSVTESQQEYTQPSTTLSYTNPCEDYTNTQDYLNCMEDMALDDWRIQRESEAGMP